MIILSLDTSSETCSVALWNQGQIDSISQHAPREHAQLLLPMIQTLLNRHQLNISDCAAIAFGEGPGSFTGLRIAASVAQGLAFAHNLPLIPISTLAALARAAQKKYPEIPLALAMLDARMHEVYFGLYSNKEALISDSLATADKAAEKLSPLLNRPWVAIGPGFNVYSEALKTLPTPEATLSNAEPNALEIAELAAAAFERGEIVSVSDALPKYLRNDVAKKSSQ